MVRSISFSPDSFGHVVGETTGQRHFKMSRTRDENGSISFPDSELPRPRLTWALGARLCSNVNGVRTQGQCLT